VEPLYPNPPHWPHCATEPDPVVLVLVGALVVTVTMVVLTDVVVLGGKPKSLLTPSKNPELAHVWLMSHIITPAKLEKDLQYEMIGARALAVW